VDPAVLANTAAERFVEGADASFLDCFRDDVAVYWEPALAQRPIVSSRDALAGWLDRTRDPRERLKITITEAERCGDGAICEVIIVQDVVPQEVWRIALAVCVDKREIREVRAFWARASAEEWLVGLR
jgi:hypothetical protein